MKISIISVCRKLILTGMFLVFSLTSFPLVSPLLGYIVFFPIFIILLFLFIFLFLKGNTFSFRKIPYSTQHFNLDTFLSLLLSMMWGALLFSWTYGVLIGVLRDVPITYVFRNFFGLTLYIIVPFLFLLRPTVNSLINVIIASSFIQMILCILSSIAFISKFGFLAISNSLSNARVYYSGGLIILFPILSICIGYNIFSQKRLLLPNSRLIQLLIRSKLYLILLFFFLIVPMLSKGFILGTVLLIILLISIPLIRFIKKGVFTKGLFIAISTIVMISVILSIFFHAIILDTFSKKDVSNLSRNEQFHELVQDITLTGNGLGAPLSSGYSRDPMGYGFELTYINLIHKLGIVSSLVFISYFLVLLLGWYRIKSGKFVFEATFSLGLMGYLIVGAGNPLLISPMAVILHSISMYVLLLPYLSDSSMKGIRFSS